MGALLFLLVIAVPLAELWVILQVSDGIGLLNTLGLLVAISLVGAWLLKQQGLATWRRLQIALGRGEMPTREATDGALILLGGALLLTPGFLTDAVGLVFLVPVTRSAIKGVARRSFGRWAIRRIGVSRGVYTTTASSVRRRPAPPTSYPPSADDRPPLPTNRSPGADDSRDRG